MTKHTIESGVVAYFNRVLERVLKEAYVPYLCFSITPRGRKGLPDATLCLPDGKVFFIEFKRNEKVAPSPGQKNIMLRLFGLGHRTALLRSKADVDDFIEEYIKPLSGRFVEGTWTKYRWCVNEEGLWKRDN